MPLAWKEQDCETAALPSRAQLPAGRDPFEPLRILLVEDDPGDATLIEKRLAEAFTPVPEVSRVSRAAEAVSSARATECHVILLDLTLPDATGLEGLTAIHRELPNVPIVVVTGHISEDTAASALREGAQDYLDKMHVGAQQLRRCISYSLERHRVLAALDQLRAQELRIKDELLSHVSHELRTPLASIHQSVTLLLDEIPGAVSGEQKELLSIALRNVDQLRTMIGDLVDVARASNGKMNLQRCCLDMTNLVRHAVCEFEPAAREKTVAIHADIPQIEAHAFGDPARIKQVLVNLLDNALKFSGEDGEIAVTVAADEGRQQIVVTVTDHGPGIESEDVVRVFDRLHQASSSSESRQGLGLGLHICKTIVEKHGGRIWVETEPGQGSTFSFSIPSFNLRDLLRPVLRTPREHREVALILVELLPGKCSKTRIGQKILGKAHERLERCILPDVDLLLPAMDPSSVGPMFVVVAATGDQGASVLARRLEAQLAGLPELVAADITIQISAAVYVPFGKTPRGIEHDLEQVVRLVNGWIGATSLSRRNRDETEEDPDR